MPLPNLEKMVPHFEITIPSTGKEVTFRPFLVKEEKILLIALESGEEKAMLEAIVQVITSCAVSPLKIDSLANFDLEYIFLQLRARSVNEVVDLTYRCHNIVPIAPDEVEKHGWETREQKAQAIEKVKAGEPVYGSCDYIVKVKLNLDDVKVQFNDQHKRQIYLTPTLGVNMRYPNFKMAKALLGRPTQPDSVTDSIQSIAMCVESVFDEESVYNNFTPKEIVEWVEKLTQPQFASLQTFFETIPTLAHDFEFHCPVCDYKENIHIEGLQSFFG
jgi:T4 bacteriophage base plate protein